MAKNKVYILVIGFIGVILITPYFSRAQSETLKSALGEVLQDSAQAKIEDVGAKKAVLLKVLNLSALETTELKNNLKNLGDLEEEYSDLRDQFSTELDSYFDYYKSLKDELMADDLNLEEVSAFGSELKSWRENNYDVEVKNIANFVLVFQQEKTLKIAENRFEKIAKDLAKIKISRSKNEALRLLNEAKIDLKEARDLNISAQKSFLPIEEEFVEIATTSKKILSEEKNEVLAATSTIATTTEVLTATSTETLIATSTEVVLENKLNVQKLVENALFKIKDAYLKFFRVSALIKKLR